MSHHRASLKKVMAQDYPKRWLFHASLYAEQATQIYLFEREKRNRSYLFDDAVLETRPATREDYYVPPDIADRCLVVTRMSFGKTGCQRLGCFPFKEGAEDCKETDPPHWVGMGEGSALSCAPICQLQTGGYVDTEWKDDRCITINPYKKAAAVLPEKLFEMEARSLYHGGLNFEEGDLKFNKAYCEAYGLYLMGDECKSTAGQKVAEFLIGSAPVKAIKTAGMKPYVPTLPDALPYYLNYHVKPKRTKRATPVTGEEILKEIVKDMAIDIAVDTAVDVSIDLVKQFLKKKAPRLITQGVSRIAVKVTMSAIVKHAVVQLSTKLIALAASSLTVVGAVYAAYSLIATVLDILDVGDFGKVLDADTLRKLNKTLDYQYYGEREKQFELKPDYLWDMGIFEDEDDTERWDFYREKVEEYLDAITKVPTIEIDVDGLVSVEKDALVEKEKKKLSVILNYSFVFMLLGCIILYIHYIHVWAVALFFGILWYHTFYDYQSEKGISFI